MNPTPLDDLDVAPFLPGETPPASDRAIGLWTPEGGQLSADRNASWTLVESWKALPENHRITELSHADLDAPHAQVSTVYLGLDHQHFAGGPILIWETMIFSGTEDLDGPSVALQHPGRRDGRARQDREHARLRDGRPAPHRSRAAD